MATFNSASDPNERLTDLIEYVEHMAKLSEKAVFELRDYRQLCYHESALRDCIGIRHDHCDDDGPIWLSIDRLKRIGPPDVPEEIKPWITVAADPFSEPIVETVRTETMPRARADELIQRRILEETDVQPSLRHGSNGAGEGDADPCDVIIRLANLPEIESALQAYVDGAWREWAESERPRRRTIKIYDDFFGLQQDLQSTDGERGLEVVWGIGMARWRLQDSRTIDHPIVEQLVEISMDTVSGRLDLRPRSAEPAAPLKPFFEIECSGIDQVHTFAKSFLSELPEDRDLSPFVGETFEPILRQVSSRLHGEARYHPDDLGDITDRSLPPVDATLRVTNTWVIFARQRSDNFYINDLERLKNSVEVIKKLPGPAQRLVTEPSDAPTHPRPVINIGPADKIGEGGPPPLPPQDDGEATRPKDFFFPKPFNDDQISIIRRLAEADGVVVQGPPGTGKTHTIANIICHYLATGRRVLVTSKGEAALTVLRDHIPESIRGLTISLLTNEREGLKQLEQAVAVLANTVSQMQPRQLERSIAAGQQRIAALRTRTKEIELELGKWALFHHKEIGQGSGILPMDLAKRIVGDRARHAWLTDRPGPQREHSPRFKDEDIALVGEARRVLGANLQYLGKTLPSLSDLPDGANIAAIHEDLANAERLEEEATEHRIPALSLSAPDAEARAATLEQAVKRIVHMFSDLEAEPWLVRIYEIWREQGIAADEVGLFNGLVPDIIKAARRRSQVLSYAVVLPERAELNDELLEAVQRAASGSRLFGWVPMGKSEARTLCAQIRIEGREPSSPEEWNKVVEALKWRRDIMALASRWAAIADEYALPALGVDVEQLGRRLSAIVALIERVSNVLHDDRAVIEADLPELFPSGLSAAEILGSKSNAERAAAIIQINLSKSRLRGRRERISEWLEYLRDCSGPIAHQIAEFLSRSVGKKSLTQAQITDAWQGLCRQLSDLHKLRPHLNAIERVAQEIADSGAPNWANALRTEPVNEAPDRWTPATWRESWNWARQESYLGRIDGRDRIRSLANELLQHEDELRKTFQKVVEERTFLGLMTSMTEQVQSALVQFVAAIRRIGKGTGIRARRFRRDARTAMERSYSAVPCWIMPTWRVSESLPAELGSFDLVIVDEASQSDITALPALVRGKKVLIVGDDKQVSPTAAFIEERRLLQLKHNFLQGQPFASLMLPGGSLYDLAGAVFPGRRIMLHEHFRCVEPIIRFSMQFYNEPIVPLRIPKASERLDPPLVDVYVPEGHKGRDQINKAEADAIVDEIEMLVCDPAYSERSIGVISLIGHKQAHYIQGELLSRIGEDLYVAHDITCGNPATFQGKERDIMFVSMVECSKTKQARTALLWEQRFNVAFSRARDRMYLYRSVREDELKPDDLKARAIRHFESPMASAIADVEDMTDLCDSGFERDVFRRLVDRGYRVTPQVRAGRYAIDIVVEGDDDRRLAIELDGDQYHTPDQWTDDLARQRTLERMGWRFWRCWGSSYYLNPDGCIEDLVNTLDSMSIKPLGGAAPRNVYTEHRVIDGSCVKAPETASEIREQPALPLQPSHVSPSQFAGITARSDKEPSADQGVELVQPGDRVLISYTADTERQHTVRISESEHDPDMYIIGASYPLAQALLGGAVDDEIEIPAGDGTQLVTILSIDKAEFGIEQHV